MSLHLGVIALRKHVLLRISALPRLFGWVLCLWALGFGNLLVAEADVTPPLVPPLTSSSETYFPPDIKAIKQRGKLVVAVLGVDSPPFFMQDATGHLNGIDISLAKALAQGLGVDVVFNREAKSFDGVVELVATRQADIALSKLSLTLPRSQKVLYSQPYVDFRKGLLFNRLHVQKLKYQGKRSVADIMKDPNTTIGVLAKSSYVVFAKELFPNAKIVPIADWEEIVDKIIKGELTAALYDELEVRKVMLYQKGSSLLLLAVVIKNEYDPIHAIVPWENERLLKWVNNYLTLHKIHYTAEEVLKAYDLKTDPSFNKK